ncbi:HAMP domain-containing sensor histidine kinase [Pseudoduganella chitinolytica]|uniref:histidine kinase n=2 Tax=Pseudoduganella chitinolytica TaxID=34070 RepID=A0ABY8BCY9_9BURK|nr:HAMP domain-containing sensor histidine kinase [Pseudoduganella chitinolytica]WEF33685.1 HAMP domain-containing sensor histidine kinase [Pseudoduganella chitinolytica]
MLEHGPIRLADFIEENMEPILQAWEDFARTIEPPALTMDDEALRDHARQMLHAFARDLKTPQTPLQQSEKSMGRGARGHRDTAAETHAEARLLSGYTVVQLVPEYRALRTSVLTSWSAVRAGGATDLPDVTRFNEAVDQALAESVARYEQMVKQSQNMFLAILGHDLRNPLGTVVTGSSFIMQAVDIPPKYILAANRIFNSSQRMNRLIADLIDFTRTHLGPGIPVKVRQANLARVCRTVVDELRTCHPEQMVAMTAPEHLDAIFDEGRIAQVLSNLVGNAIQYGTPGAPVTVSMVADDSNATIAVNNHGPVVPADRIPALFDPMVRMANDTPDTLVERTSLGLGLFIARQIVQAHGGHIDVVSNAQEGTTFTVTLPRQPGTFLAPRPGSGARPGEGAAMAPAGISPAD